MICFFKGAKGKWNEREGGADLRNKTMKLKIETAEQTNIQNVFHLHISIYPQFIPFGIKATSPSPHDGDVRIEKCSEN